MNGPSRTTWLALAAVLAWRLALLLFTAQPIPANDAFPFDGPVVNWLLHGQYTNPSLTECFPISGKQVFSTYPPLYQAALLPWMAVLGTSVLSAITFHLFLFGLTALLVVILLQQTFPAGRSYGLPVLLLLGITFGDRPEDLAHVLGLAALLLTTRLAGGKPGAAATQAGLALLLLSALYTSPVVGAFYYGAAFLTCAAAWLLAKQRPPWVPFAAVVVLFVAITFTISRTMPLAWQGFLENSAQTPVLAHGFRKLAVNDLLKLIRSVPVFLLFAAALPVLVARRQQLAAFAPADRAWLALTLGLGLMGLALLAGTQVLLSPNYVTYVLFSQVLLAAGLLALTGKLFPSRQRWLQTALVGCLLLVSVRAIGMSTWGVACALDVSHGRALGFVRDALQPFAKPGPRVVLSSAYLYEAARVGVRDAVHSDWLRDRRVETPDADFKALVRLRSPLLVLTQFDFHRFYAPTVELLRARPDLVTVRVRDTATTRAPDSIPSLQRVVQHISWAPVIVELDWK